MSFWLVFMMGCGAAIAIFLLAWLFAKKWDNYSLVDAVWAVGIGVVGCLWMVVTGESVVKHWVAGLLLLIWSLRLGWYLQRRIRRHYPEEDARYLKLREVWSGRVPTAFFWFFQAQGISVVVLAFPFLLIAADADYTWSFWEYFGLAVTLVGISGESLADFQMSSFKSKNRNSDAVCQQGLWRYSRHPNYFFEGVIWIGFYVYACGSMWGWMTIYAPTIIIFLLLRVTGIPPTEAAAVLRKGEAYRRYQKTTNSFIPWTPKKIE
jgi:steroid 5-alpha reductase family enzyme